MLAWVTCLTNWIQLAFALIPFMGGTTKLHLLSLSSLLFQLAQLGCEKPCVLYPSTNQLCLLQDEHKPGALPQLRTCRDVVGTNQGGAQELEDATESARSGGVKQ